MMSIEKLTSLEKLSRLFEKGEANAAQLRELSNLIKDISNPSQSNMNQSEQPKNFSKDIT